MARLYYSLRLVNNHHSPALSVHVKFLMRILTLDGVLDILDDNFVHVFCKKIINSLLKMVVLAVVILVFLLLFGIFYGFHRLGFGAIFTLILPIETFLWYKICNLWTEQTNSTLLKTIIRISKWFFVIVTACYELFLLFNWARIL